MTKYTSPEIMTLMAAREIRNGDIVFCGTGISMLAAMAAKNISAPDSVIVNVQGDEPALNPEMLSELIQPFDDPLVQVTTLGHFISAAEAESADRVKIVRAADGRALYFSRAKVPFGRDNTPEYIGHIGLYGLRMHVLEKFSALGESPLEKMEKLEQLRLLEAGIPIHVALTRHKSHGVDRPEDLPTVTALMRGEHHI